MRMIFFDLVKNEDDLIRCTNINAMVTCSTLQLQI